MPSVLAVLFWVWTLASIVILVRRRVVARRGIEEVDIGPPETEPLRENAEARVPLSVGAPAAAPSPVEPAPPPPMDPGGPRVDDRPAPRSAPGAGIADALVGIRMPCDLVPLVVDRLASDSVTLSTIGYPAETVGEELADEVERLGYVVHPVGDREIVATRGATELRLTITPPGADGRHYAHPSARDESIVVVIALS